MQPTKTVVHSRSPAAHFIRTAICVVTGWLCAATLPTTFADTPQEKAVPAKDQSKAIEALQSLVQAIKAATQTRATVELTSRSMINGQVVASDVAVYQIASKNRTSIASNSRVAANSYKSFPMENLPT